MSGTANAPSFQQASLRTADGVVFPLKAGENIVGRDPSCNVQLHDLSVSKKHCLVTLSESGASIADLGSTNHTFVNETCLREGQSTQLFHGDRLVLGRSVVTFFHPELARLQPRRVDTIEGPAVRKSPSESTIVSFELDTPLPGIGKQALSEAAFRELRKANERLSVFYDFGRHVGGILDVDQLLTNVARRIMKLIPADGGVMFLKGLDRYEPFLCWTRDGFQEVSRAVFSRTALARAIEQKRGLLVRDVTSQPELSAAKSVRELEIQSTMIVPIVLENEVLGALSLSGRGHRADFGPDDFDMISGIAGQIGVALKNAHLAGEIKRTTQQMAGLQKELEIAAHVQKSILPAIPPSFPGLEIAGASIPAREVGGDFFDYVPLGAEALGATIADVSGKGLAAALLTLQSRCVIHALARDNESPADVLRKANLLIYDDYSRADMFLSAFYGIVNPASGTLRYASGGHNPPLLLRADGTRCQLYATGGLLGISPHLPVAEREVKLAANDILALYTDGVSEARDNARAQFGCERLAKKLGEYRDLPAQEIAGRILQEVTSFAGCPHFDDATIVIIKV